MHRVRTNRSGLWLLTSLLLGACGQAPEGGPPEVAAGSAPIINGSIISAENSGAVQIGGCSGTLMTNEWALSAAHCFTDAQVANPGTVTVVMGSQSALGAGIWKHPSLDAAIVRLQQPLRMDGSTVGYRMPLYNDTAASLQDRTLFCAGYGQSTYTGGFGTLRAAFLRVSATSGTHYTLAPNGSGQIQWLGDSGGSCISGGRITGVQSTCTHRPGDQQVLSCDQVAAPAIRDWADWVVYGFGPHYRAHDYFCVNGEECRLADVNGDGRADLVTFIKNTQGGAGTGDVWVALSQGTSFGPGYRAHDYFCVGNEECQLADVNGDGRADLVTFIKSAQSGAGAGDVWVALSQGTSFGPGYRAHDYFCIGNEDCRLGDVNGDGRADLITFIKNTQGGAGAGDVWVALSQGTSFGPIYRAHDYFCVGNEECRVADINGDGRADLVTFIKNTQSGAGAGDVWATLSQGTSFGPIYRAHDYFCVGNEECRLGDLNGDGKADLVAFVRSTQGGAGAGDVWGALSYGTSFGPGFRSHDYFCIGAEECQVGDINGDRRADAVTFIKNTQGGAGLGDVWATLGYSIR